MKLIKRVPALLLILVLLFSLTMPVMAEGEAEEPNLAMPVVAAQPQNVRVRAGYPFTLSVEANIPNGDEIGYKWRGFYLDYSPADTSEITVQLHRLEYGTFEYIVEVYNQVNPEYSVTETVSVEVYRNLSDRLYGVFGDAVMASFFATFSGPLFFVIAPLMFLVYLPVMSVTEVFRWIFE